MCVYWRRVIEERTQQGHSQWFPVVMTTLPHFLTSLTTRLFSPLLDGRPLLIPLFPLISLAPLPLLQSVHPLPLSSRSGGGRAHTRRKARVNRTRVRKIAGVRAHRGTIIILPGRGVLIKSLNHKGCSEMTVYNVQLLPAVCFDWARGIP